MPPSPVFCGKSPVPCKKKMTDIQQQSLSVLIPTSPVFISGTVDGAISQDNEKLANRNVIHPSRLVKLNIELIKTKSLNRDYNLE